MVEIPDLNPLSRSTFIVFLCKAEIMSLIWSSNYSRDHLLSELKSELRKAPFKSEFTRTQPNEGYQWNVTTKSIDSPFYVPQMIAASFVTGLV
jgi:hypothetical protein